ncbi:MAG TPA: sterol desaturase family protein [bacterium]|nr:sterol desaturase family protein [bacterium]
MTKLIMSIIALALIFWLEGIFPLFQGRKHRLRHAALNLSMGILNGLMVAVLFSVLTVKSIEWSRDHAFGLFYRWNGPLWLEGIAVFVLFDLWMYAWHRANHRIPFLWRFHRMHHSDLEMDTTTALRFHFVEIAFSSLLRLAVLAALGMNLAQFLIYEATLQPIILFHHSNVALPEKLDRIFRTVIVTPNMHRVHHSQDWRETNSNYSSVFSFWDRIVRTFRKRRDTRTLRYGLPYLQEPEWQTFPGLLKTPLARIRLK